MNIDHKALGISDEDMAIAGRVARAIHEAAKAACVRANRGKKSEACKDAVADTLLRAGGWMSQREATKRWYAWLREAKTCTVQEAHEARVRIAEVTTGTPTKDAHAKTRTAARLTELETEGRVRYVRADRWDPGKVTWLGDP